jgi:hypothetical protein
VDAFQECAHDSLVIFAIARLFRVERKIKKARHWEWTSGSIAM